MRQLAERRCGEQNTKKSKYQEKKIDKYAANKSATEKKKREKENSILSSFGSICWAPLFRIRRFNTQLVDLAMTIIHGLSRWS